MTNRRDAAGSPYAPTDQRRSALHRRGLLGTLSIAGLGIVVAGALALVAQLDTPTAADAAASQDCSTFGIAGCSPQAHSGAVVYANVCVTCHGERFEGKDGPPLAGPDNALADYRTVRRLYEYVSGFMPDDDPGSLSEREYLDVLAFILQVNGLNPNGLIVSPSTLDDFPPIQ